MLDMLRSRIRNSIDSYIDEPNCRRAMLRALSRPGFVLHQESKCRAGVLTLNAYRAAGGSADVIGVQAAAAVELQMNAAYMFDNVADDECASEDGLSVAEELALAIAALSCGSAAACHTAQEAGAKKSALDRLVEFHGNFIGACGGQFLDAYMEKRDVSTTEEALNMTFRKSGSLGRFAATFGAGIATDDQLILGLLGEFGFNLFTYLQLIDDLRDACPADGLMRDLMQGKKTVPLVFFLLQLPGGGAKPRTCRQDGAN